MEKGFKFIEITTFFGVKKIYVWRDYGNDFATGNRLILKAEKPKQSHHFIHTLSYLRSAEF